MSHPSDLDFEVRAYDASRALDVARLHALALPDAFLTSLGAPFLTRLYAALAAASWTWIRVAVGNGGNTLGFVAGCGDLRGTVRHVLIHAGPKLLVASRRQLAHPGTWHRMTETLSYPRRDLGARRSTQIAPPSPRVRAELLSIGVDEQARRMGIGRALVHDLEARFRDTQSIAGYRVVTASADARSNAFYVKTGFALVCDFEHHGRPMSLYEKRLAAERPAGTGAA